MFKGKIVLGKICLWIVQFYDEAMFLDNKTISSLNQNAAMLENVKKVQYNEVIIEPTLHLYFN